MGYLPKRVKQVNSTVVAAFLNAHAVMAIVGLKAAIVSHVRNWTQKIGNKKKRMREHLQQQVP